MSVSELERLLPRIEGALLGAKTVIESYGGRTAELDRVLAELRAASHCEQKPASTDPERLERLARDVDHRIAATLEGQLCLGCPPAGTESGARCTPCPRRSSQEARG